MTTVFPSGGVDALPNARAIGDVIPPSDNNNLADAVMAVEGYALAGTYKQQPVRAASTGNLTLSGAQTVDGVALAAGDRVLVKNQTAPAENGIYVVAAGAWARAQDANASDRLADIRVVVEAGAANGDTEWYASATAPVVGTTALPFRRVLPFYGHGNPRNPWAMGGDVTPPIMESMPRVSAVATGVIATGSAVAVGGIVLPAGRPVASVSFRYTVAPTAAPTVNWVALMRQADRVVLAASANSVAAFAAAPNDRTLALTAAYTPTVDTPVYVVLALTATGGATVIAATPPVGNTGRAPILVGTTTVPTATPPAAGTALAALAATAVLPYVWLT